MLRLNRSRPFGKVTPPLQDETMDRPAYYEQDGRLFDQFDCEIIPGRAHAAGAQRAMPAGDAPESAAALLAARETIPWPQFKRRARHLLGDRCPATKADIIAALQDAAATQAATTVPQPPSTANEAADADHTIDLAAWGRGQKNYVFGEVRRAIRQRFSAVVNTTHDAVDLLIAQRIVTAQEARRD
jgi:hypothetical protein